MVSPRDTDPDTAPLDPLPTGGLGWLSIAAVALVAVLLTVHVVHRWDVRSTLPAPSATAAKTLALSVRSPS